MPTKLQSGAMVGKWRLDAQLALTPHSAVWRVADAGGVVGALKVVKNNGDRGQEEAARLSAEIRAMRACQDIEGVLPLLDSHIDEDDAAGSFWLVSKLAEPLESIEKQFSLVEVVDLCLALAKCLSEMHARGYYHRDIKPPNVFRHDGRWCLGDFGLVDFPGKEALTSNIRRLGPQYYLAPEMLNLPNESDGAAADVYSLGKLFWREATGSNFPVPGTHDRLVPALTISQYFPGHGAAALNGLLEAMTKHDPMQRPKMDAVVRELEAWKEPSPPPANPLDLRSYEKRFSQLMEPSATERDRLTRIQIQGSDARNAAFYRLGQALTEMGPALHKFGHVDFRGPAGGNANFLRLVPGYAKIGTNEYPAWVHEHSVTLTLTGQSEFVCLDLGINLCMQQLSGEKGEIYDLGAPVIAAVGCIVRGDKVRSGKRFAMSPVHWVDNGEFIYGQPSEGQTLERLDRSLRGYLQPGMQALLDAFEELQKP